MISASATEHFERAVALHRAGKLAAAEVEYDRALACQSDWVEAWYNRGLALSGLERWSVAHACFDRVLALRPDFAQAYNERGVVLYALGRYQEAMDNYDRAEALVPGYADALINRGAALAELQRPEEALACYERVLEQHPEHVLALNNRGNVLRDMNRLEDALASYDRVILVKPNHAAAFNNRGVVLHALGRFDAAVASYSRALALKPGYADAHRNLGLAYLKQGNPDAAADSFNKAMSLKPEYAQAYTNLGTARLQQNKPEEAILCFKRALEIKPDYAEAYSDYLLALLYRSSATPEALLAAHRGFAERFETPLKMNWPVHVPPRIVSSRLKVGYVSADFRNHSVARFIEPVLAHHDRSRVEVYCYYNNFQQDTVTARIAAREEHWVVCKGWSNARLAERIRADGIDILVDLAGHTGDGRLLSFARKPAPVQVTYLGYAATTGLSSMDYRITHADVDPPGSDKYYSEVLYRLPRSLWCYRPPTGMPAVTAATPAIKNGFVTFGSVNNLAKISPETTTLWLEILRRVPGARLVMTGVPEGSARRGLQELFVGAGIAAERVHMEGRLSDADFWQLLQTIDITLDPFPYTGTTTTCEALWMGLPVVTLQGTTCVARSGYALLKQLDLAELVASSAERYVEIAVSLARDIPQLDLLHRRLRPRIESSPLRDEAGFTLELETAYDYFWQTWVSTQQ